MQRLVSIIFCFVFLVLGASTASAQTHAADSVQQRRDTSRAALRDTLKSDTTSHTASGVDTLVNYSAKDSIIYSLRTRYMDLYGNSETQYQLLDLKAERINVNWDSGTLAAHGVPDTSKKDSVIGKPIMKDGGEEYHGDKIGYNFRTRKGKIDIGTTHMENGYYVGEQIKKVGEKELFVADGSFTSCDRSDPHYYFASPKMKVYMQDKIVAEPVYFYLDDVPLFALPFGVFPNHSGRASGLIMPAYGNDDTYGWYFSHLGYYWAASDYWDMKTMFDLYTRGKWKNETDINYKLRYYFDGGISASITSLNTGDPGDPTYNQQRDYYVHFWHKQIIDPVPASASRLDVDFTFMSSTYFKNFSSNVGDILTQDVISNATYSKTFGNGMRSFSVNVARDYNLQTQNSNLTLPSVGLNMGTFYPFKKQTNNLIQSSNSSSSTEQSFWDLFGITYSANGASTQAKVQTTVDSIKSADTLAPVKDYQHTNNQTVNQNVSFSLSPKVGNITIAPFLSFADARNWTQQTSPVRNSADSSLTTQSNNQQSIVGSLSTGVGLSTRFYGMAHPDIFNITALRQTITPNFNFSYNKQVYGTNIPKYSLLGAFSLGNNFEMKYKAHDTSTTENKLQLMDVGLSTSYDFVADSMNLKPIAITYRTAVGQFNLSGGLNYNPYYYDPAAGVRVNKYVWDVSHKLADLTSFNFAVSTSLRGEKKQPAATNAPESVQEEQAKASGNQFDQLTQQRKTYYSLYDREDADFSIPWNVSISYSFSQSQDNPSIVTRSSSANISASFNLTPKWQISSTGWYDFVNHQKYISNVDVSRDLHCWQMKFTWYPMGTLSGFRLELKVKAPELQDIKITKAENPR
ncbi:MAG TPA: putative LPS assembly protein LptD [Bacteroidota bacterium]|nr:putative LPS assembly protein LptD [Bacteroidota bacterium]